MFVRTRPRLTKRRFVHQHDEEFDILKKERRAGRPASTREDVLRMKISMDEKEYENGFCQ
jgi:translation machinery-associated protein 16